MLARYSRTAALVLAGVSLVVSPTVAIAVECPDPSTVSAARLLEFKTMMMVVGLRCKSVGVLMAEHSDQMAAMRSTMFEEANRRVRRYIYEGNQPEPVVVTPDPPPATETVAAAARPKARLAPRARGAGRGRVLAKGRGRAGARGAVRPGAAVHAKAATAASATVPAKTAAIGPAKAPRAGLAKAAAPAPRSAPRSKREDPYEMYLTRVGTTYGMGDNSLGTCRKYDALVSYLGDPTTPNRALTKAAESMIALTMLERQRNCPVENRR